MWCFARQREGITAAEEVEANFFSGVLHSGARNQAVFKDGQADLLAQTIRWWDHDFFSGNLVKMTLCTTGCAELLPKYPVFLEGVLELLCRDAQCPSWKYDNGRFFKITPEFRKHSVNQSDNKNRRNQI